MRYLKIASAKNPDTDFIELNDFNGFLCTVFQSLGISRKHEFLGIENRQFSVDNKLDFHKYRLTIEILTKYSEYERKHRELITFLDRNKKSGLRLYYRPYDNMDLRYCLCDIESSIKSEKMQPVLLTLVQDSLWFGEQKIESTSPIEQDGNIFQFKEDDNIAGYYSAGFYEDENITDYYCIKFFNGALTTAIISNDCFNEIPLVFRIKAPCVNPTILLYKQGERVPYKQLQILATLDTGYIEIDANIMNNGVRYKRDDNDEGQDYSELINNALGSPYFYIDNGEYYIEAKDDNQNVCYCDVFWQEEYSE